MPDINGIPYVESSDLVSAYPAASQALAQEVSDQLAEKLPYSYGTATPSTTVDGFLWYDENDTPPTPKFWDGAAFQSLTSGKILQVLQTVKTDTFSSSSGTMVDITGLSVSITPSAATSKILVTCAFVVGTNASTVEINLVRDSTDIGQSTGGTSNQTLSYITSSNESGNQNIVFLDSPNTTSATTYKVQARNASSLTFYVGRSGVSDRRAISTITVMEVSA